MFKHTVQTEIKAELAMPQENMIKEVKQKLSLGNKLPTEVTTMTLHEMLFPPLLDHFIPL